MTDIAAKDLPFPPTKTIEGSADISLSVFRFFCLSVFLCSFGAHDAYRSASSIVSSSTDQRTSISHRHWRCLRQDEKEPRQAGRGQGGPGAPKMEKAHQWRAIGRRAGQSGSLFPLWLLARGMRLGAEPRRRPTFPLNRQSGTKRAMMAWLATLGLIGSAARSITGPASA